jgi:hypothetical protein
MYRASLVAGLVAWALFFGVSTLLLFQERSQSFAALTPWTPSFRVTTMAAVAIALTAIVTGHVAEHRGRVANRYGIGLLLGYLFVIVIAVLSVR